MKCKIFHADGWAKAEAAVNAWLAQQGPTLKVHLSETRMHTVSVKGQTGAVSTVTVWYD